MHSRTLSTALMSALVALCGAVEASAQATTIRVDLAARSFSVPTLPFGETFAVRGTVPKEVKRVRMEYGPDLGNGTIRVREGVGIWERQAGDLVAASEFLVFVAPLTPDVDYIFRFSVEGTGRSNTPKTEYGLRLSRAGRDTILLLSGATPDTLAKADTVLVGGFHGVIRDVTPKVPDAPAVGDTVTVFAETKSTLPQYFDADIGVLRSVEAGYVGLVSNAHFYPLAPQNRNMDLALLDGFWANVRHRVSLFGGLALQEITSDVDVESRFDVGSPVFGVGLRGFLYWPFVPVRWQPLLQPLRLNAGIILLDQKNPNPLISEKDEKHDLFLSITGDIELKSLLGPLVALF